MTLPRLLTVLVCTAAFPALLQAQSEPEKKPAETKEKPGETKEQQPAGEPTPQEKPGPVEDDAWKEIVDKKREEIRDRIRTAQHQMRQGDLVKTHVRVRVKLRNGERLEGVVKNGRYVEKPAGLEFVRSEMKVNGAGIRIFFYNGTSGYIFIPYRSIETYRVLERLTELQVKSIHDQMKMKEQEALEFAEQRRKEILEKEKARAQDKVAKEELTKEQAEAAAKAKIEAETKRLIALVEEFPPSEGWGAEKIAELERRAIIIDVYPNERERRFIDNFEDWKKGLELQKVAKKAEKASEGSPAPKSGNQDPDPNPQDPNPPAPQKGSGSSGPGPKPVPTPPETPWPAPPSSEPEPGANPKR